MVKGVSRKKFSKRDVVGIGRVIIPANMDREDYIKQCYQTSTVSMVARENLDFAHNVEVDKTAIQNISFPVQKEEMGSTVVWVNLPFYDRPVIIAVLNTINEMTSIVEGGFSLRKDGEDGSVAIEGNSNTASITINALSTTNFGGKMKISVGNFDKTGELDVTCNGSFILSSISTDIISQDYHKVVVYDGEEDSTETFYKITNEEIEARINETTSGYKFDEESFEIGDASSTAVVAEGLETFINDFIDQVAQSTVTTSLGTQPLLNATQITALKQNTSDFFSEYLKLQ